MIQIYSFKPYNDNSLIKYLQNYVGNNPCCLNYPSCDHPLYQSDANVFNAENPTVEYIKNQYFKFLDNTIGPHTIKDSKAWVLNIEKNTNTLGFWHQHFEEKYKDSIQISGICYISPTKIGTEFDLDHCTLQIKPMSYTWYIWNSSHLHRPMGGIQNTDRIIIATQTALNKI